MANLRVSVVTHENHPLEFGDANGLTIGQAIDEHISDTINRGQEIVEVSLFFSNEEQAHLRAAYGGMQALDGMGNPLDGGPITKKAKTAKHAY